MNIDNWFPIPILHHEIENDELKIVQDEISRSIPLVIQSDLSNPWGDKVETSYKYGFDINNYLTDYKCDSLADIVLNLSRQFLKYHDAPNIEKYKIINSWINFSRKDQFQFDHCHSDRMGCEHVETILSGVYYFRTNGDDGDIVFSSPNLLQLSSLDIFSRSYVNYTPKIGKLLLFPSWLQHKVALNKTDNIRISISFNVGLQKQYV
jgi:uncharacterized protein (TIGR02466 family)